MTDFRPKIRIGVLYGGRSGEHEVSLRSARSVMTALDPDRYEVVPIGITKEGRWVAADVDTLTSGAVGGGMQPISMPSRNASHQVEHSRVAQMRARIVLTPQMSSRSRIRSRSLEPSALRIATPWIARAPPVVMDELSRTGRDFVPPRPAEDRRMSLFWCKRGFGAPAELPVSGRAATTKGPTALAAGPCVDFGLDVRPCPASPAEPGSR